MRVICLALSLLGLAVLALAEPGEYVPNAYFNLDPEGHVFSFVGINPQEGHARLKRQGYSASSTTTTFSNNGGPTYFSTSQQTQGGPNLSSRFGGDDSYPSGISTHASGVIHKDGTVEYHKIKNSKL